MQPDFVSPGGSTQYNPWSSVILLLPPKSSLKCPRFYIYQFTGNTRHVQQHQGDTINEFQMVRNSKGNWLNFIENIKIKKEIIDKETEEKYQLTPVYDKQIDH